jgi:polyisoprenoid-binding protein YceI
VPHFDQNSAECLVFTYKEGLLSAVAHDLQIRVGRFDVDVDDAARSVKARFDARSLEVVTAMKDGAPNPDALGDGDKRKIEQNIADDVLAVGKHPEIRFTSTSVTPEGDGFRVEGDLALHGRTRPLTLHARPDGDRLAAEVSLHQPDFGIKPYTAMLGTLKVKADVTVRCAVPRGWSKRQGT